MSTIVIKIGGGEGIEPTALSPEIASLVREGHRVVRHARSLRCASCADRPADRPTIRLAGCVQGRGAHEKAFMCLNESNL